MVSTLAQLAPYWLTVLAIVVGLLSTVVYLVRQVVKLERELEERQIRRGEFPPIKATFSFSVGDTTPTTQGRSRARAFLTVGGFYFVTFLFYAYAAGVLTMTGLRNPPLPITDTGRNRVTAFEGEPPCSP